MESMLSQQCISHSIGGANQIISILLGAMITSHCSISNEYMWPEDYGPVALKEGLKPYDFIIIGAGTAGSVLANRLSENPDWNILVLEAGGDPPIESEVPFMSYFIQNSSIDWKYFGEKSDKFGIGHEMGIMMPRGKMLGGTSGMNYMFYVRGSDKDYDSWEAAGNPSWNWTNVLKYFKKSENMLDENVLKSYGGKYHNVGGLMDIGKFFKKDPKKKLLADGLNEIGIKNLVDFNGPEHIGTAEATGCIAKGLRQSPAKAFLTTAMNRPNLHVIKNAYVTSLQIDSSSNVTSLNFQINGEHNLSAAATKEYILSAGVFNSPQILMLSGIGPKEDLVKNEIHLHKNLNVGGNLQDHVIVPFFFKMPSNTTFDTLLFLKDYYEYLIGKTGRFTSIFALDMITFLNSKTKTDLYPDIQAHYVFMEKGNVIGIEGFLTALGFSDIYRQSVIETQRQYATLLIAIILLNPKSKGKLELRSNDPYDKVKIYPNYISHSDDIDTLMRGIRKFQRLQKTKTFQRYRIEEFIPKTGKCDNLIPDSNSFWECYIRYTLFSGYHNVGTCKMGPSSDPDAVVNSKLSVHGINNLRVVDSSIIPDIISGNTFAPTVMIAEKASDFIKTDWNYLNKKNE